MMFRILIIGGRQRFDYARLRDALDVLLAKRLVAIPSTTSDTLATPSSSATLASSNWPTLWCSWETRLRCVNCWRGLRRRVCELWLPERCR
ncbi:MAG: hypothetical protein K8U57_38215 [Planctomycetes bacterium]|nr:hypothetical protein [Planctomycetota bacterium]